MSERKIPNLKIINGGGLVLPIYPGNSASFMVIGHYESQQGKRIVACTSSNNGICTDCIFSKRCPNPKLGNKKVIENVYIPWKEVEPYISNLQPEKAILIPPSTKTQV